MHKKIALRSILAVVLAVFTLNTAKAQSGDQNDSTKYRLFAGLTLVDHAHAPFVGGAVTHTNGFSSIASLEFKETISAVRYNGALRLKTIKRLTISAAFGPEVEAPKGDLFGADKITYLMASVGGILTLTTPDNIGAHLAALYMTPDKQADSFRVLFAISIPID